MKRVGFTLIELLIVVAIIAILAAIAIPNFLQAQVRAKVSRVQADMRSVATALESYYVDYNDYVPDYWDWMKGYEGYVGPPWYIARMVYLTTPIAYMSSIPQDAFAEGAATGDIGALRGPYTVDGSVDGELAYPLTFDFAKRHPDLDDNPAHVEPWERIALSIGLDASARPQLAWALRSVGPDGISVPLGYRLDQLQAIGIDGADGVVYDPTNGTISAGQIYRTNIGQH